MRRLTQSIVDLLGDKERRERLGIEGRKEVLKRATVRHMVDGMEAAIRYAVAQKSS